MVERWNPHARIRQDLFGCIDVLALESPLYIGISGSPIIDGSIIGIQACAGSSHSARLAKIKAEPRMTEWIKAGGKLLLWSWSKRGPRGKAKRWVLREEVVTV